MGPVADRDIVYSVEFSQRIVVIGDLRQSCRRQRAKNTREDSRKGRRICSFEGRRCERFGLLLQGEGRPGWPY